MPTKEKKANRVMYVLPIKEGYIFLDLRLKSNCLRNAYLCLFISFQPCLTRRFSLSLIFLCPTGLLF